MTRRPQAIPMHRRNPCAGFLALILVCAAPVEAADKDPCEQGHLAGARGDWSLAADFFEQCAAAAPLSAEAYLNLGVAYRNTGAPLPAIAWLRAYIAAAEESDQRRAAEAESGRLLEEARRVTGEMLAVATDAGSRIPEDFWEDRQRALGATALVEALAGRVNPAVQAGAFGSRSRFLRAHGELLVAAHDYATVQSLLKAMAEPAEADRLRAVLANHQLMRGERGEAAQTVMEMRDAETRRPLLRQLVSSYARTLDTSEAAALIAEAPAEERGALQEIVLLSYLRADRRGEAEVLAHSLQEASPASGAVRAALGQGAAVMQALEQTPPENADVNLSEAYLATLAALWSGQTAAAEKGCALIEGWSRQSKGSEFAAYAVVARAYLDAETGRVDEALAGLKQLEPRLQTEFAVSLFWRLATRGRLDDIQRLVVALEGNPAAQGMLFTDLVPLLSAAGRHTEALVTAQVAADHAVKARLGFVLRGLALWADSQGLAEFSSELRRRQRVAHWASLADSLTQRESTARLDHFLDQRARGGLQQVTAALHQAAGDWISALAYIRAISERHEPL